jgi:hypothetical protein
VGGNRYKGGGVEKMGKEGINKMEKLGLPLREFVYFDREKIEDFVSALLGGLPSGQKETTATKPSEIGGSLGIDSTKIELKKGTKEITREELLKATDASLFENLHSLLEQEHMIKTVDASKTQQWDTLQAREFVEFEGRIEFSTIEMVFDLIKDLAPLVEAINPEETKDNAYQSGLQIALMSQQGSHNIRIIPKEKEKEQFIFVASLQKDKARASKEELRDEYTIFGRVRRKLAVNETFELFSPLPGGVKLQTDEIQDLLSKLKDVDLILGSAPKMEDLRVSGPAIILTPIAVYR